MHLHAEPVRLGSGVNADPRQPIGGYGSRVSEWCLDPQLLSGQNHFTWTAEARSKWLAHARFATAGLCDGSSPVGVATEASMADLLSGVRLGPFIVFKDENGLRHAVRQGAVLAISEMDEGAVTIQMTGGRAALVRQAFERVLRWFR
jgi:hypothetical protein